MLSTTGRDAGELLPSDILHIRHNPNSRGFQPKRGYCLGILLYVGVAERMAGIWQVRVKKSSDGSGRNRRGDGCTGEHVNDLEAKSAWVFG